MIEETEANYAVKSSEATEEEILESNRLSIERN